MLTCHPQFPQSWTIYLLWPLSILMIVDCLANSHQAFSSYQIWSFFCAGRRISHRPFAQLRTEQLPWRLEATHLRETSFSGELPTSIGNLNSLNELEIWSCNFSGLLPFSLGNVSYLKVLDLSNNSFRGQVPSSWKTFPNWLTWHFVTTISVAVTFLGLVSWTNSSIWSFATSI